MSRLATPVLAAGIALALLLRRLAALSPDVPNADGITVLAIAAPRTIASTGAQSIHAGLALPEGEFGVDLRVCAEGCRTPTGFIAEARAKPTNVH